MNKITIILLSILAVLFFLYFFLPDLSPKDMSWDSIKSENIDRIIISSKTSTKTLKKDGDLWITEKEKYRIDPDYMNTLLDIFTSERTFTLISKNPVFSKYDLDDANRITAEAFMGDKPLRKLFVGKNVGTDSHTFVLVENDTNIYQTGGNFSFELKKDISEIRDKKIISFEESVLSSICIEKNANSFTIIPKRKTEGEEVEFTWEDKNGKVLDQEKIMLIVDTISYIDCSEFLGSKQELLTKTPVLKVTIKTFSKENVLSVVENMGDRGYSAYTNDRDYAFIIDSYSVERLFSDFSTFYPEKK